MKKLTKYITYATFTAVSLLGASCGDFGDLNVSPNGAKTPLTSALLTNSLSALGGTTTNTAPGLYCQYFSETQYTDASRYSLQDVNWSGELAGSIMDLQQIINFNTDPETAPVAALNNAPNANQIAVARILKAYRFSVLTDRYGDMPYFEALKTSTQPVFDSQEDIYNDLFKELDEAVKQFVTGPTLKGDILFGGDITKWKKFANSWRLILALRVSKVDPALGEAQFKAALTADDSVIVSNSENVTITYPGNALAFQNPWFGIGGDFGVSETVSDFLNSNSDLRLNAYGKPNGAVLVGFPYGLPRQEAITWANANPAWSKILNDPFRTTTSTLAIITYADVLLARAEAAHLGWTTENRNQLYSDGIKASWERWGVFNQASFDTYITRTGVDLTLGSVDEKIGTQRWLSFFPNGNQGWAEWRRTGYPVIDPTPFAINNSKEIPVRLIYPSVEYNYNGINLQEAVGRLDNGDTPDSHVWWDVED